MLIRSDTDTKNIINCLESHLHLIHKLFTAPTFNDQSKSRSANIIFRVGWLFTSIVVLYEGLLFFSTPNRRGVTTNPHHFKEFNYKEIKTIFPKSTITGLNHRYVSRRLLKLVTKTEEKTISRGFKLDQLPPFSWYPYGYGMFLIYTKPKDINI